MSDQIYDIDDYEPFYANTKNSHYLTVIKTFIVKFLNELCFLTKFTSTYIILMQINIIHVLMFHVVLNYLHLYLHFLP